MSSITEAAMATVPAPGVIDKHLTGEFEQLFRDHAQFVYRTAYGVTGNAEDAEDVLQTIFARLLCRQLPENLKQNPKAYLYRAAVNASLSAIRSRRSRSLNSIDFDTLEAPAAEEKKGALEENREGLLGALQRMAVS